MRWDPEGRPSGWGGRIGTKAAEADPTDGRPLEPVKLALWLGIVVGFAEVVSLIAVRRLSGTITYETLRTNWHYGWMIPVSYVALFGTTGLLLSGLHWLCPGRFWARASVVVLAVPAALAVVLAIPRLHWMAAWCLALAAAVRIGQWASARGSGLDRIVARSLPWLLTAFAVLVPAQWWAVSTAEQRFLASLPKPPLGAPNVLLIVLDTARYDGVFPEPPARDPTPFLTRLGSRGVRFDEARSTAPWTLPSHASLFTGRWPHELSATVRQPLDDAHPTLAEHLAWHGYATAAFMGNTHNANAWYGLARGFARYEDHYENTEVNALELVRSSRVGSAFLMSRVGQLLARVVMTERPYVHRKTAAMINRDVLAWIDRNRDRPFFATLNYYDAHDPYEPPPGEPRPFSAKRPPGDNRPVLELARDLYDDCLAYLDSQLSRLFDELGRRGLLKETVVIVTADHGEAFGEHRLQGHGISLYRPELHVPLLVVLPSGAGRGQRISVPVSLRDIPATIAELTGTRGDSPFPGRSLSRFWTSASRDDRHDPVLAEVDPALKLHETLAHAPTGRGPVRAVVTDGHVFIRNGDGQEELYDLDDLDESDNLADEPADDPPLDHYRETLERLLAEREGRVESP